MDKPHNPKPKIIPNTLNVAFLLTDDDPDDTAQEPRRAPGPEEEVRKIRIKEPEITARPRDEERFK